MEITMKGISKAFGSNEVLKGVDLTLKSGEIHALMGENGAGKSTLMNILTGIHKASKTHSKPKNAASLSSIRNLISGPISLFSKICF